MKSDTVRAHALLAQHTTKFGTPQDASRVRADTLYTCDRQYTVISFEVRAMCAHNRHAAISRGKLHARIVRSQWSQAALLATIGI